MNAGRSRPEQASARLVVVSTPIGNIDDLSRRAIDILSSADVVLCEDTRHTGSLLARVGVEKKRLVSLNSHNERDRVSTVIEALKRGEDVVLVSDAGTPLVSDPGARLVDAVIEAGYPVMPVPGPSAALAALVVSGFDTSRFEFFGFLPKSGRTRKELLSAIADSVAPAIVFESPKRIVATLADLESAVGPNRRVVVARELTKLFEETWRGPMSDALARARSSEPIGEHVLVIEGRAEHAGSDQRAVRVALAELVDAGLTPADAGTAVEVLLGVPHRVAYEQRLALAEGGRGPKQKRIPRSARRGN